MSGATKPIPVVDGDSAPFWNGCREGKLLIQRCLTCGNHLFYPRVVCPHCMSDRIEWTESSGRGKVYSFTVARVPAGEAFAEDVPYVVALVELEEGVRMMTNLTGVSPDDVRCDMPVEVVFEERDGFAFPKFTPRG
jgi:hypothetical protein